MKRASMAVLFIALTASASQAATPEQAWGAAQGFHELINECPGAWPASDLAPVEGSLVQRQGEGLIRIQALSNLPPPDPKTAAWLASRIPGLNTAALKAVPYEPVDAVLQRASAAKASYLDVFSDPGLGRGNPDLYYLSQEVLERTERKWISGTLPVTGKTKDGQDFHMQALVVGNGTAYLLYDLAKFSFKDAKNEFKITDAGRVGLSVLGAADVGIKGLSGCGCKGPFCGCAELQRITKTGPNSVRVKTSRGDQNSELKLIRLR